MVRGWAESTCRTIHLVTLFPGRACQYDPGFSSSGSRHESDPALVRLVETEAGRRPDVIVSDYQLSRGLTGIDAIERLRSAFPTPIPALLISGDASSPRCEVGSQGYHLLYKPVNAERLHAALVAASVLRQ